MFFVPVLVSRPASEECTRNGHFWGQDVKELSRGSQIANPFALQIYKTFSIWQK